MPKPMKEGQRSFTIEKSTVGYNGGRFVVSKPEVAARHAAKSIYRAINRPDAPAALARFEGVDKVDVAVRETTMGSRGKVLYYRCTRESVPIDKSIKRAKWLAGRKTLYEYKALSIYDTQFGRF